MGNPDPADELLKAFGEAVRAAREKLELSQEGLGFESDIDRTYISGVERGVRNPTLKTIVRLCRALEVRPSSLLRAAEHESRWGD